MRKEYLRYGVLAAFIIFFAIFVYPTLYKYDKLDQKFPVKINRITGETQILMGTTWESTEKKASVSEIEKIKTEIEMSMNAEHNRIKQEVISETKDEIIQSLKEEIASLKESIAIYQKFQTDPDNYFTTGDTTDKVKEIMGVPDRKWIGEYTKEETWHYGRSQVNFKNGKVTDWSNNEGNLRLK